MQTRRGFGIIVSRTGFRADYIIGGEGVELRVLRYFLTVAREESVTRAAKLLHITQPTLSRQLMQLEDELGVRLFRRSKYRVVLTDDGALLRRRAQELVDLAEQTEREFRGRGGELAGEVFIGCAETDSMGFLSGKMAVFRRENPRVSFSIYSATADDVKDRLERGLLDIGLLSEPVELSRYEFIRLGRQDVWGALVQRGSPLSAREALTPSDLAGVPLLLSRRREVRDELAAWFGPLWERVEVAASYNLVLNAANMVEHGMGAAICFRISGVGGGVKFVPLEPELRTGCAVVWKKDEARSPAAEAFLRSLNNA